MQNGNEKVSIKQYRAYLVFMLIACGGAFIWQFFLSDFGGQWTSWPYSAGWQREIALWNIGIISAIIIALMKGNIAYMKILAFQSTVLCLVLGASHLISLLQHFSFSYLFHILGIFEVLLVGGGWGTALTIKALRSGK